MFGYRKLNAGDARSFGEHVVRLSPDDRRSRFAGTVSDREIHRYCASLDWTRTTVIGFFDDGVIRAAVELRMDAAAGSAEAAFSVERDFQGKGIGSALMRRIVTVAQNSGITRLRVFCLPENWRMRALLARFSAESEVNIDEVAAAIQLRPADPLSLAQESFDDGSGYLPILFERWYTGMMSALMPSSVPVERRAA